MQARLRGNPDQVPVSLFVLRQHQQMVVVVALAGRAMIFILRNVKLAAQNRLHPLRLRRLEEVHRPIDVPVVGHRHGLLPQRRHPVNQLGDVTSPVQQRVLRMQMQMRKFRHD
jgi:hypothetical protein